MEEVSEAESFLTEFDALLGDKLNKGLRLRYGSGMERVENVGISWPEVSAHLGVVGACFFAMQLGRFNEKTDSYVINDVAVFKVLELSV